MPRGRAIVPRNGGESVTLELPAYAVRYLHQMCQRERTMIDNLAMTGVYGAMVDAARDALNQIELALR